MVPVINWVAAGADLPWLPRRVLAPALRKEPACTAQPYDYLQGMSATTKDHRKALRKVLRPSTDG